MLPPALRPTHTLANIHAGVRYTVPCCRLQLPGAAGAGTHTFGGKPNASVRGEG